MLNLERSKYMTLMHEEINKLGQDFERFEQRWDNLSKHIGNVQKDVSEIHVSSQKLTGRFKKIRDVEIEAVTDERLNLPGD
jgi:DNA recombination protein RmuC